MNIKIVALSSLIVVWVAFCAFLSNRYCCGASVSKAQTSKLSLVPALSLTDGTTKITQSKLGFQFDLSDATLSSSLPDDLQQFIGELSTYLQNHPEKRLVLTGLYKAEEKSINPELGLDRAAAVESLLLDQSIPAIQIRSKQDINDQLAVVENKIQNTINFEFEAMPTRSVLLEEMKNTLSNQKISLYFDLAEKEISLTPAQRKFFENLRYYLNENKTLKVSVIGYTDNEGEPRQNKRLGRERAAFVKDFMLELDFKRDNILTDSKGEADPIATNSTKEGRAKNRRVEVALVD